MDSKSKQDQNYPGFDPTVILSKTDASVNHNEASYLFNIAKRTHGTGKLIHIGNPRSAALHCLAEAARVCGRTVRVIDVHHEKLRQQSDPRGNKKKEMLLPDSLRELGLDRCVEKMNYPFSGSERSGHIDCIAIDGRLEREGLMQTILTWKNRIGKAGVIVICNAQDGDQVDRAIDESLYRDSAFIEIQGAGRIRGFTRCPDKMEMILCSGLQSGGTTLVSWCFLQRADMSGTLDMWTEGLQLMPYVNTTYGWCKMTISCFRWQDVADFYADQGWTLKPLLVVRDVRSVYASLRVKPYGINGTTAQDPPLKIRFKRFFRDWEQFRANDWPIIRYESLITEPEETLKQSCSQLGIPWHEDMLTWPKSPSEIPRVEGSNRTFRDSLSGQGFEGCVIRSEKGINTCGISMEDLSWLEKTFSEYNNIHGYPAHVPRDNAALLPDRPKYLSTQHQKLSRELDNCKIHISKLMQSKSWKITAPVRYIYDLLISKAGK
jgi:hypothetical protein